MDILLSALESAADSRTDSASEDDDPAFIALLSRVTQRITALGTGASAAEVNAAALALVQDVAQYTLSWAEPEGAASQPSVLRRNATTMRE